jgi:hypothetical protein
MAAGDDRRLGIVLARSPREDIANRINADRAAGILAPADEQVAALAVEIGEGEAADAAFLGGADFRQLHQALPQPLAIDLEVLHRLVLCCFHVKQ